MLVKDLSAIFIFVLRSYPTPPSIINQSKFQIATMRIQSGTELGNL